MTDPMAEFTERLRGLSALKMPAFPDMGKVMGAYQRNVEALSAANRVALEGAQAVARRHMEIVQQTMAELTDGMKSFTSADAPQAKAARQAELLKSAYERALANTRELSDMIKQSNDEALGLLNSRFVEALDEVKTLTHTPAAGEGAQPG